MHVHAFSIVGVCRVGDTGTPELFIAQNIDNDAVLMQATLTPQQPHWPLPSVCAGYEGEGTAEQLYSALKGTN